MATPREDEDAVTDALARGLARHATRLEAADLRASSPRWERSGEHQAYFSEVRVSFFDAEGLVDVIEFVVFKEGSRRVGADELTPWLDDTLLDVAARAERGRR